MFKFSELISQVVSADSPVELVFVIVKLMLQRTIYR
jgi:hypothetical protein